MAGTVSGSVLKRAKDEKRENIAVTIPEAPVEIQEGNWLVVEEEQAAALFTGENVLHVFGLGNHELSKEKVPELEQVFPETNKGFLGKLFGKKPSFQGQVCFIDTGEFTGKWGTPMPITVKDQDLGFISLSLFGDYNFRVSNPGVFFKANKLNENPILPLKTVTTLFNNHVIMHLTNVVGEKYTSYRELPGQFEAMAASIKEDVTEQAKAYGISITALKIEDFRLPETIRDMIAQKENQSLES